MLLSGPAIRVACFSLNQPGQLVAVSTRRKCSYNGPLHEPHTLLYVILLLQSPFLHPTAPIAQCGAIIVAQTKLFCRNIFFNEPPHAFAQHKFSVSVLSLFAFRLREICSFMSSIFVTCDMLAKVFKYMRSRNKNKIRNGERSDGSRSRTSVLWIS